MLLSRSYYESPNQMAAHLHQLCAHAVFAHAHLQCLQLHFHSCYQHPDDQTGCPLQQQWQHHERPLRHHLLQLLAMPALLRLARRLLRYNLVK